MHHYTILKASACPPSCFLSESLAFIPRKILLTDFRYRTRRSRSFWDLFSLILTNPDGSGLRKMMSSAHAHRRTKNFWKGIVTWPVIAQYRKPRIPRIWPGTISGTLEPLEPCAGWRSTCGRLSTQQGKMRAIHYYGRFHFIYAERKQSW